MEAKKLKHPENGIEVKEAENILNSKIGEAISPYQRPKMTQKTA